MSQSTHRWVRWRRTPLSSRCQVLRVVLEHPGLSIKPLTCSIGLLRRDRWSGKRRRSSLYSMILQGGPVLRTLPWCSKCVVTLQEFLHFCSLRLPTILRYYQFEKVAFSAPSSRALALLARARCFPIPFTPSLCPSFPHPPPPFFSPFLAFSRSLFPSSLPLSPALSLFLSFTHTHTLHCISPRVFDSFVS